MLYLDLILPWFLFYADSAVVARVQAVQAAQAVNPRAAPVQRARAAKAQQAVKAQVAQVAQAVKAQVAQAVHLQVAQVGRLVLPVPVLPVPAVLRIPAAQAVLVQNVRNYIPLPVWLMFFMNRSQSTCHWRPVLQWPPSPRSATLTVYAHPWTANGRLAAPTVTWNMYTNSRYLCGTYTAVVSRHPVVAAAVFPVVANPAPIRYAVIRGAPSMIAMIIRLPWNLLALNALIPVLRCFGTGEGSMILLPIVVDILPLHAVIIVP